MRPENAGFGLQRLRSTIFHSQVSEAVYCRSTIFHSQVSEAVYYRGICREMENWNNKMAKIIPWTFFQHSLFWAVCLFISEKNIGSTGKDIIFNFRTWSKPCASYDGSMDYFSVTSGFIKFPTIKPDVGILTVY